MTSLEQVLTRLKVTVDRTTVETYVARAWVRPVPGTEGWQFEDIDVARIDLVTHLRQELAVNDEAVDIVLSLLDQLYDLRARIEQAQQAAKSRTDADFHPLTQLLAGL
jgi:chaperone modulatory protein CbpM